MKNNGQENNEAVKKDKPESHLAKEQSGDAMVQIREDEYKRLLEESSKAGECWEKFLRVQADFENARKRWDREKQDCFKFANETLIRDLLNVVDDLERTLELAQAKHNDFAAFLKGVEMILAHLYELLKTYGAAPIEAKGKSFDPHFHEALMQVDHEDLPENTIVEELQKGYLLNNKLIRTSKVKVSRKKDGS